MSTTLCVCKCSFNIENDGKSNINQHTLTTKHCNFLNKFLLGYVHDMGGFIVTIPIRLTLYISYIAPIVSPPQPPPLPT
jgi:hypothetical protein